jgi:transcriptional regulator with XRE-family HTH domain
VDLCEKIKSRHLYAKMTDKKEETIYVEISHLDYLLICHVREIRKEKKLTQLQLSHNMKLADGFVSKVETFSERAKYNIRHLKLLSDVFECDIIDLIPKEVPIYDIVRLTLKRINKTNMDGSVSNKKETIVIKIEPVENK